MNKLIIDTIIEILYLRVHKRLISDARIKVKKVKKTKNEVEDEMILVT